MTSSATFLGLTVGRLDRIQILVIEERAGGPRGMSSEGEQIHGLREGGGGARGDHPFVVVPTLSLVVLCIDDWIGQGHVCDEFQTHQISEIWSGLRSSCNGAT